MSDTKTLQAGSLIAFSSGEYSDYGITGFFVVLQDITQEIVAELREEADRTHKQNDAKQDAWTKESGEPYPPSFDRHELFVAALIRGGHLLAINYSEIHLGGYGELDVVL